MRELAQGPEEGAAHRDRHQLLHALERVRLGFPRGAVVLESPLEAPGLLLPLAAVEGFREGPDAAEAEVAPVAERRRHCVSCVAHEDGARAHVAAVADDAAKLVGLAHRGVLLDDGVDPLRREVDVRGPQDPLEGTFLEGVLGGNGHHRHLPVRGGAVPDPEVEQELLVLAKRLPFHPLGVVRPGHCRKAVDERGVEAVEGLVDLSVVARIKHHLMRVLHGGGGVQTSEAIEHRAPILLVHGGP